MLVAAEAAGLAAGAVSTGATGAAGAGGMTVTVWVAAGAAAGAATCAEAGAEAGAGSCDGRSSSSSLKVKPGSRCCGRANGLASSGRRDSGLVQFGGSKVVDSSEFC